MTAPTDASAPAPAAAAATGEPSAGVAAARGALFIGFAKIYFMVSGFFQQVLLTRVLNVPDYGAFAVVNSMVSIVNNTIVSANVQSVSKFTAEDDRRAGAVQRTGLRMQALICAALGVGFFLAAPALARFANAPTYTPYFRIAAAIPFLYSFYTVFVGTANGLRRFRTQAGFDVGFSTIKTILLLGMAALWHVAGAFAGFATAALVIAVASWRVMRMPAADRFSAAKLLKFWAALMVYALALNLALNYDLPLLRRFAGEVAPAQAGDLAAYYQGIRNLALLPYQFLVVITFVIFPLVSRSTFSEDREATRVYVSQTLRYALILATVLGLALAARPGVLLGIVYRAPYGVGTAALPILVFGQCCLGLLGVSCSMLNAAGRTKATRRLMILTVAIGGCAAWLLVPRAAPGAPMLIAAASATSLGMLVGLVASIVYLRTRLGGSPPLATVARVAAAAALAVVVGRFLPAHGRVLGLLSIAAVSLVYAGVLVATGEFSPEDRAKFKRVLRRR